jgi:hypothetical protein
MALILKSVIFSYFELCLSILALQFKCLKLELKKIFLVGAEELVRVVKFDMTPKQRAAPHANQLCTEKKSFDFRRWRNVTFSNPYTGALCYV